MGRKKLTKEEAESIVLHYLLAWATLICDTNEDYYHEGIPENHCLDKNRCIAVEHGSKKFFPSETEKKIIANEAERIASYLIKRKLDVGRRYIKKSIQKNVGVLKRGTLNK